MAETVEAAAPPADEEDVAERPPLPAGWRVVARKELADHLLSVRFTLLVGIIGLAAVAAVYSAGSGIREVAEPASGSPGLFLKLFSVSAEPLPFSFFEFIALLGPLLGVAFGFDAVNGERSQGTLPRLLAQPIYRDDVINGKFVAGLSVIAATLSSLMLIVAGVGFFRIGVVPSPGDVVRFLVYLILTIVYVGFWLALATLFSVVVRRAASSAISAIAVWLVSTLFSLFLASTFASILAPVPPNPTADEIIRNARYEQNLQRIFPSTLYVEATIVLLNPEQRTRDQVRAFFLRFEPRAIPSTLSLEQSLLVVWPQVTGLVALTALCFGAAYISFMRQEVRA